MATVYSVRIMGGGAVDVLGATCPAGIRWIVRDVLLFFDGAESADAFNLSVGPGTGVIMYGVATPGHAQVFEWQGRTVIEPGEELVFGAGSANWYVLVSGYALTLP